MHYLWDLQTFFFTKFFTKTFIKNKPHNIIYKIKNYFTTVI